MTFTSVILGALFIWWLLNLYWQHTLINHIPSNHTVVDVEDPALPKKAHWKIPNKIKWQSYDHYLQSDEWKKLKETVLVRDNYKCAICGTSKNLNIHHITYERLYNENSIDLVTLCKYHHSKLHKILGKDRKFYPINILKIT